MYEGARTGLDCAVWTAAGDTVYLECFALCGGCIGAVVWVCVCLEKIEMARLFWDIMALVCWILGLDGECIFSGL